MIKILNTFKYHRIRLDIFKCSYEEALDKIYKIQQKKPDDLQLKSHKADCLFSIGCIGLAKSLYLELEKKNFVKNEVYRNLCVIFFRDKNYLKSIEYAKKYLCHFPNNEVALSWLAFSYQKLDNHPLATQTFKNIISTIREDSLLKDYDKKISLASAYRHLAQIYFHEKQYKKADDCIDKAIIEINKEEKTPLDRKLYFYSVGQNSHRKNILKDIESELLTLKNVIVNILKQSLN